MKWAALIVAVLVAGTVAAFAIYTFGSDEGLDNERARVQLAAEQIAGSCREEEPADICTVLEIERVAEGLWRMRAERKSSGRISCLAIDLEHFRMASNRQTIHGTGQVPCS